MFRCVTLLILFCITVFFPVYAQEPCNIDSLTELAANAGNDSIRIRRLLEAGWFCRYQETDKAITALEKGLETAKRSGFDMLSGNLYLSLGVCWYYKQNYTKALDLLYKGLPIAEKYNKAYIKASILTNIGNIYNMQRSFELARKFYIRALNATDLEKEIEFHMTLLNNLGTIEGQLGNYNSAVQYLSKAIAIADKNNMEQTIANTLNNLGIGYLELKDFDRALKCHYRSFAINTKYKDSRGISDNYANIAHVYTTLKQPEKAFRFYDKALEEAARTGYLSHTAMIYEEMSQLSAGQGDYKKAYEYQKQFKLLNDSLFNTEKSLHLTELNAKYDSHLKDQEIDALKKENTLKETLGKRQLTIIWISVIALGVVIVLLVLLNKNIKEKKLANQSLVEKNILVTTQKTEIEKQKKELENYTAELEKENIIAQYETLKNQVNPHFLFNSLNVLASLIKKQPQQAYVFAREFAKIYRVALSLKENLLIHLNEEMDFVQSYIYLQKMRFGDSLHVNVNIPEAYLRLFIPPFSVQMIIENAIKHNVVSETSPLFIEVFCKENTLVITNNLQRRTDETSSTGIGSKNLVQRYSLITQEKPEFLNDEKMFTVNLPLITEE
jgi:tetratricopeptide (TPR) repeat protein